MTVIFFSATGNSLAVAKAIADRLLSLHQILSKKGTFEISDSEGAGLVFPVHFGKLPAPVAELLRRVKDGEVHINAPYIFAVATYGELAGRACSHIAKALADAGLKPDYIRSIKMVDNNFSVVDVARQIESQGKKQIPEHLREIASDISARRRMTERPGVLGSIVGFFMDFMSAGKDVYRNFYVEEEKCSGCGVCAQVCPTGAVSLVDHKPQWRRECIMCTACYHNCSKGAIRFKGEKSRVQYRNPAVGLREIVEANGGGNKLES